MEKYLDKFLAVAKEKSFDLSYQDWFDIQAEILMNHLCLKVGENAFRVVECEFYYDGSNHADPYCHNGNLQMKLGNLYLNKVGGVDITFGNESEPAWGGILIRGVRNLKTNVYTSKVTEVTSVIFEHLGNIALERNAIYLDEKSGYKNEQFKTPVRTTRVGLTKKEEDDANMIDRPYRYLVELNPLHKFRDKEKVVREMQLLPEKSKETLNYILK